jgi:hypothetical protein
VFRRGGIVPNILIAAATIVACGTSSGVLVG